MTSFTVTTDVGQFTVTKTGETNQWGNVLYDVTFAGRPFAHGCVRQAVIMILTTNAMGHHRAEAMLRELDR